MKTSEKQYAKIFNQCYQLEKHFPKLRRLILEAKNGQSHYTEILQKAQETYRKYRVDQRLKDLKSIEKSQKGNSKGRGVR